MAKYSDEFKLKIVLEYKNGNEGYKRLCDKYGLPSTKSLRDWVYTFDTYGADSLKYTGLQKQYSYKFKYSVVKSYLEGQCTVKEAAIKYGIHNAELIRKWAFEYQVAGINALKPRVWGHRKLKKPKQLIFDGTEKSRESIEYVQELEEELLKCRIEDAYLKELRRLRLEEETLLKEQRESSTASEENSN